MKREIRSLTGLRGIAALLVMVFHYVNYGLPPTAPSPIGAFYVMVDLFFVLSGFVMAMQYGARFERGISSQTYLGFLEARVARVYPLYALATIGAYLLIRTHVMPGEPHPNAALIPNLLAVQNLGAGLLSAKAAERLVSPGWSISTEAGAYLLFPVLVGVVLFRSWWLCALSCTIAAAAFVLMWSLPYEAFHQVYQSGPLSIVSGETLWPLLRCVAGFTLGLAVFRVAQIPAIAARRRSGWVDLVILAGLGALLPFSAYDVLLIPFFPLLVLQLCTDTSPLARLLGSPVPHRLGLWSYAIYLVHVPMFVLLREALPTLRSMGIPHPTALVALVAASASIALAAVLFRFYEAPTRNALRAFFGRRRLPITVEASAP